jgi:hypothetical protein
VWSLVPGNTLPSGLSLDGTSGTLSGTPTQKGPFQFAIRVTGKDGARAERTFSFDVVQLEPGILYVKTNGGPQRGDPNVTTWRFQPADTIDGQVSPSATIDGGGQAHGLVSLQMYIDVANDTLWFTRPDAIERFVGRASTINGSVGGVGVLTGTQTQIVNPNGLAVDVQRDIVYVSEDSGKLLVFRDVKNINGNVPPSAVITSGVSNAPLNLFLDEETDTLYLANEGDASVSIFENASTLATGNGPSRVLQGLLTTLVGPRSVLVDRGRDILYVGDIDANPPAICVFANASTINGNVAPVRRIAGGNTNLGSFFDMALHPQRNELYVANNDPPSILVFSGASSADGDVAPDRTITHPDLEEPNREPNCIALDTTR